MLLTITAREEMRGLHIYPVLCCAGKNEGGIQLEALSPVVMRHRPDQVL
jgi:hypothetical protein